MRRSHKKLVVAVGTSTGGPRALLRMLLDLPADFLAPIVIVQHMPKGFTKSLAERLHRETSLQVKEASQSDVLELGHVYIAPGGYHMKLKSLGTRIEIVLTKEAPHMGHRPSVDLLFQSLANLTYTDKIAVVLTGMGKDGAEGVKQIKQQDPSAMIIAESKKSAIIDGMPKATIDTGLTSHVLHLHDIGATLTQIVNRRG